MKKKKTFFSILGLGCFVYLINKIQFLRARTPIEYNKYELQEYPWRFGTVRYCSIGRGKPLVLLHHMDAGGSMLEWEDNIKSLARHYKLYLLDMPGYGLSDKPKLTYTSYLYAAFLNEFIQNVVQKPAAIAASGDAGGFALLGCRLNPQNYTKILLVNPGGGNQLANHDSLRKYKLWTMPLIGVSLYNWVTSKTMLSRSASDSIYENRNRRNFANQRFHLSHMGGPASRFSIAAQNCMLLNVQIDRLLKEVSVPLCAVFGEDREEKAQILKKQAPAAKCSIIHKTRQYPHYENPKAFYNICISFLES